MEHFFHAVGAVLGSLRALYRQVFNRYFGTIERFEGDASQVCRQVLNKLWEGDFYRTSLGHFDFFWMRDFGTVAESLTRLGHRDKVHHTLRWALRYYRRSGAVTLCIDSAGNTFNAPATRSIDALPWLLHSVVVSNYPLNHAEHSFLERQLRRYIKMFLDPRSGFIRDVHFAEMRDAVVYDRSAYAIALVGRMAKCVELLKLDGFPFPPERYRDELLGQYWNGDYFNADTWNGAYSSECALMPFFLGVIDDAEKAARTFNYITAQKLNRLAPLRYTNQPHVWKFRFGMGNRAMPNYTGTTIWTWHATFYLHLLKRYDRPEYQQQYDNFAALIERHGNYPELVNSDGSWYYAPFYRSDPGMVWAALFLTLPGDHHA
ncbi:hypothetical protein IPM09_00275 [Candidatus Saccharibacteria bacterium]|nr:MAG: hypothetical protein IPM09_00275 [Candidatus Saccharibacteria bacterium]